MRFTFYKIKHFLAIMQPKKWQLYRFPKGSSLITLLIWIALMSLLAACHQKQFPSRPDYQFTSSDGLPNYADLHYWAAHPWKHDPSDSVPKPLRDQYQNDSLVDVFFVHPTTLTSRKKTADNASIDDAELNARTDYSTILYQASAFNQHGRVFAPRYRQMHYRHFYKPESMAPYLDIAYSDVKKAFDYYLQHYNHGRPIVLASHSQGTIHAVRLLKEYFEGKPLSRQLVCAYLIGKPFPSPQALNTQLPPCQDSTATGCYVAWRTFKKGYQEKIKYASGIEYEPINTNPLSWRQDTVFAPASLNKGGILKNFNKLKPGVTDAMVNGHKLWSRKPRFFGNFLITTKIYHIGDINLFYSNVRENMAARVKQHLQKNK
jgi:hypothetical protein